MSQTVVRAEGLDFDYAETPVLRGVSLEIPQGEIVVLHGPSGCGKSTLLKVLLGFLNPQAGTISFRGTPVSEAGPDRGYMAQEDSLFPWYTLRQNLLLGSRVQGEPLPEQDRLVSRILEEFGLHGLSDRYPDQLSGGQRQRGALARALLNRPAVLFADEPFRALDTPTRLSLLEFFWKEVKQLGVSVCMVSHDVDESLLVADRILVLTPRPAKVMGVYEVTLPVPRTAKAILSTEFHEERKRYVEFCNRVGATVLPGSKAGEPLAASID